MRLWTDERIGVANWIDEKSVKAAARADFYARLEPLSLAPLWEVLSGLVVPKPMTPAVPARWRLSEILPFIEEAGELISAAEAERRVLILENPGMIGQSAVTSTLYAGLQVILPGEIAPAHRHTQSALRFIMEGDGAFTALNGERAIMHRYDLVLTPSWVWHDHGNETQGKMIWLDGLDIPLIRSLDAGFAEHRADRGAHPRTRIDGDAQRRWGANLRPARINFDEVRANPLFIYPHATWRASLDALRAVDAPHEHDAYRMEFVNPVDGGAVLNTISAFAQLIPSGFQTRPIRSSDSSVHVVTGGAGHITIGDAEFDVIEGDILVVPTWEPRVLKAETDLVLFSYSDKTVHQQLGLWREDML